MSQKLTKCRRKIGNKMIFSSKIQEMTNCSKKIRVFARDQMMLGGYKYDRIRQLKNSVF